MKQYKVEMCLQLVINQLREYKLYSYNDERPIIFVEANDPDQACSKAYKGLLTILMKQNSSLEALRFYGDIIHDVKVTRVYIP